MEKLNLKVKKRELTGKKAKKLRTQGWVLGNIYGKDIDSLAVMIDKKDFDQVFKQVGETGIIELKVEDEDKKRPTLVKDVQSDVISGDPLHVDFYQVNLKQKVTATVPLEFIGESEAVKTNIGMLLTLIDEIEVECLPEEIPSEIQVDISGLTDLDQAIFIKDLNIPPGVELKVDPEEMICKIEEAEMEEVEEEPEVEAEEAEEPTEKDQEGPEKETKDDEGKPERGESEEKESKE